ncbi:hypothetical protein SAMN05444267_10855, partial [Chryseobacterium polytrichastri]
MEELVYKKIQEYDPMLVRASCHKCSKPHSGFKISFTLLGSPPHLSTISLIIS